MLRHPIKLIFVVVALVFTVSSCKKPEKSDNIPENILPAVKADKLEYFDDLRIALGREDQLFRQLMEHSKKFELSWPYTDAIKASRLRLMKIEAIFRDNRRKATFSGLATNPAESIENALKADAELLANLANLYDGMVRKEYEEIDTRLLKWLHSDVKRYQPMFEKHDGVSSGELKEYGQKKYQPRQK